MILVLAMLETVPLYAIFGTILFGAAGTMDIPRFWAFLWVILGLSLLSEILIYFRSPGLLQERMKPGKGEQDKVTLRVAMVMIVAHYVIAGLDVGRWHLTSFNLVWLSAVGFALVIAGFAVVVWSMLVNPFFSVAVRIQEDRGQKLITGGPYQFVRHPGYTGGLLYLLFSGVALGSWLSILPMLVTLPVFLRRTIMEDRMLYENLAGYKEYAGKVRYRLIPGVW